MKLSKIYSAVVISLGMMVSTAHAGNVETGSGQINFTGTIVDAPCSINPDSDGQEVRLGQVAISQLKDGGKSTPRHFSIELENCSVASDDNGEEPSRISAAKSVSVTFDGAEDPNDSEKFGIFGNASGAGVVITDTGGNIIKNGETSSLFTLNEGRNTLDFAAYLEGTNKNIESGEFTSIANFTMNYE